MLYSNIELIFVDGGSTDQGPVLLTQAGFKVVSSVQGRGEQMNTGAACANGDILWFIHCDTDIPHFASGVHRLQQSFNMKNENENQFNYWGFSLLQLALPVVESKLKFPALYQRIMFILIQWFINTRSSLSSVATGDQCQFFSKTCFQYLNGFRVQPLLEDVDIAKRARQLGPPIILKDPVITSSRRWVQHGIWRTIILMWRIRYHYWRGVCATQLAVEYSNQFKAEKKGEKKTNSEHAN